MNDLNKDYETNADDVWLDGYRTGKEMARDEVWYEIGVAMASKFAEIFGIDQGLEKEEDA